MFYDVKHNGRVLLRWEVERLQKNVTLKIKQTINKKIKREEVKTILSYSATNSPMMHND